MSNLSPSYLSQNAYKGTVQLLAYPVADLFRFSVGNHHSVQNLLSSRLLSKNLKIKIYRTIILPVSLYGCETWSLTLREERKLRVFENMVLRRILGPRRDEVAWKWRRLHNEELNDLYCSPSIVRAIKSRRMRWAGHVARMDEERGCIGSWWETGGKETTGET